MLAERGELIVIFLYCEVNILCMMILGLMLFKICIGQDRQRSQRLFKMVIISGLCTFAADTLWALVVGNGTGSSIGVNYFVNDIYFISTAVTSFLWLIFSESIFNPKRPINRRFATLAAIPIIIISIMVLCSYKTGWIFYVDSSNLYHRGKLYFVQVIVVYGYIILAAIRAIIKAVDKDGFSTRRKFITLGSFSIFSIVAGWLQIKVPTAPLICAGITISILWVYMDFQDQRISIDQLTGLNNRGHFINHLAARMRHASVDSPLYLIMLDIDGFKQINDYFGHVDGDQALSCVADALRRSFGGQGYFIARYGGDEFSVICENCSREQIDGCCAELERELSEMRLQFSLDYRIAVSFGIACCTDNSTQIQSFIRMADNKLYEVKKQKKKAA